MGSNPIIAPDSEMLWNAAIVWRILRRYEYTGALVMGRRKKIDVNTTSIRTLPEDKWIITEKAHEAIVTKDEYYQAQKAIRNVTPIQYKVGDDFALKGKICCGNCKRQLRHEKQYGEMVFCCGYKRAAGKFSKCYGGYYREYSVNAKVARAIKTVFYALDVVNQGMQEKQSITVRCMDMLKRLGVVIPSTILTLLMAVGFSTPAFAFVDTTEVTEEPTQVIEEAEPTEAEKIPFTIAGNGEVEDNMMDDPSKEFFTVKTKGGNTFFLVIDRARNSENVYMLSMIDEYDLQEFLDDEERNGKQEEETPAVVLPETKPEPIPDVEIEEPKEESSGGMNKILLLVFVAALGGAGAFFYFYIYKPKPKEETPQSENLETDQSLATVNEDNQSGNENDT